MRVWNPALTCVISDMTKSIVVAQGKNEDLGWMDGIDPEYKRYIYTPKSFKKDYGREAGLYIQHILKEWDGLADVNVFTQAHPLVHCKDFINEVKHLDEDDGFKQAGFKGFGDWKLGFNKWGYPEHPGIPLERVYEYLFPGKPIPFKFSCTAAGMFAVRGENIRRNGREYYGRLEKLIDYSPIAIECFCIERFWHLIFTKRDEDMDKSSTTT